MSVSFFFHPEDIEIGCEEIEDHCVLTIKDKGHMAAFFGGHSDMYDLASDIDDAVENRTRENAEGDES